MLKEVSNNTFFIGQLYVGTEAIGIWGRQRWSRNAQGCEAFYRVSQNINGTVYGFAAKVGFISLTHGVPWVCLIISHFCPASLSLVLTMSNWVFSFSSALAPPLCTQMEPWKIFRGFYKLQFPASFNCSTESGGWMYLKRDIRVLSYFVIHQKLSLSHYRLLQLERNRGYDK